MFSVVIANRFLVVLHIFLNISRHHWMFNSWFARLLRCKKSEASYEHWYGYIVPTHIWYVCWDSCFVKEAVIGSSPPVTVNWISRMDGWWMELKFKTWSPASPWELNLQFYFHHSRSSSNILVMQHFTLTHDEQRCFKEPLTGSPSLVF